MNLIKAILIGIMTTNATSAITALFPHAELTRIEGQPTYLALQKVRRELVSNAMSVHSTRGNGTLGHAVIVLGAVEYNRIANPAGGHANDWQNPVHPGAAPVYPPGAGGGAPSGATVSRVQEEFARATKDFTTFSNTASALKQQLLAAIDTTYICSLEDPLYGYTNVTVQQILEHLDATYGQLDQDQLNKNMATLEEPWEPDASMEPFWSRATLAQRVAQAGNDPIT